MRRLLFCLGTAVVLLSTLPIPAPAGQSDFKVYGELGNRAYKTGNYQEAEKNYSQAIKATENSTDKQIQFGKSILLTNLGATYFMEGKYEQAEQAYRDSLTLKEELLGKDDPQVADTLQHLASLYKKMKRADEADKAAVRADLIALQEQASKSPVISHATHDMAISGHMSGEASSSSPFADRTSAGHDEAMKAHILRLYYMTYHDKLLLTNPGIENPFVKLSVKPTYHDLKDQLDYVRDLQHLDSRYQLVPAQLEQMAETIFQGGTVVELSNGWLLNSNREIDPRKWYAGMNITLTPNYSAGQSIFLIRSTTNKSEIMAKLLTER